MTPKVRYFCNKLPSISRNRRIDLFSDLLSFRYDNFAIVSDRYVGKPNRNPFLIMWQSFYHKRCSNSWVPHVTEDLSQIEQKNRPGKAVVQERCPNAKRRDCSFARNKSDPSMKDKPISTNVMNADKSFNCKNRKVHIF